MPIEEIVVTAQKREQRLLDAPLSVTAITEAEIEARNISNLIDAQYAVPGLTLAEVAPGLQRAQLRGVGTPGGATGFATVGFYVDEMPVNIGNGAGAGIDVRLLDMERIEVLRGPQPTLYGEGSMGGTVRYITASPSLDEFAVRAAGQWGSITDGGSSHRVSGMLSAPLAENLLGIRLVAGRENIGGWIDPVGGADKDVNAAEISTFRAKLLLEPSESLSVSLLAMLQRQDQDYQNFAAPDRTTATAIPTVNNSDYDLLNLTASYDFGPATLLGTFGYLDRKTALANDLTSPFILSLFSLPPQFGGLGLPPGFITSAVLITDAKSETWTQEVRLSSNWSRPFNYTLGFYRRDPEGESQSYTVTQPNPLPFDIFASQASSASEAWAGFADISFAFSDKLEVLAGGRYFKDEQSQTGRDPQKFDSFNPRLNISYKIPDGILYANAAKGFRSGGFNRLLPPQLNAPPTYGPEKFFSYELGGKRQWLDQRLTTELAVYYNKWKDVQLPGIFPAPIFTNDGSASGPGLDLSVTAQVSEQLRLSGTFGYTDMEYDTDSLHHIKGDPVEFVAELTWSVGFDYRQPMPAGFDMTARGDYMHTSGYPLTLRGFRPPQFSESGTRDVVNLRIGADFGAWEAYLFADNLTDDNGIIYPTIGTVVEPVLARPRTLGLGIVFNHRQAGGAP